MNTPIHTMQVKMLPKGFTPTGITPNRKERRSKDYANYLAKIQQAILSKENEVIISHGTNDINYLTGEQKIEHSKIIS